MKPPFNLPRFAHRVGHTASNVTSSGHASSSPDTPPGGSFAFLIPELLGEILVFLMISTNQEWFLSERSAEMGVYSYKWCSVVRVSRHWRDVALHTPGLWSVVASTGRDFTRTLLARSRETPLTVEFGLHTEFETLTLALGQLHRIERMYLNFELRSLGAFVFKKIYTAGGTPLLRVLRITQEHKLDLDLCLPRLDSLYVFFQPSLRSAKPPLRLIKSSLLRLDLRGARPSLATIDVIDALLEQCPRLEDITFDNVLQDLDQNTRWITPAASRKISLPFLNHLCLRGTGHGAAFAYFLSHLDIPTTTVFELEYRPKMSTIDLVAPLLAQLWSKSSLFSLSIVGNAKDSAFSIWGQTYYHRDKSPHSHTFQLSLRGDRDSRDFAQCQERFTLAFGTTLLLDDLHVVCFFNEFLEAYINSKSFREITKRMKNVHIAHADEESILYFGKLVSGKIREISPTHGSYRHHRSSSGMLLPNLEAIVVSHRPFLQEWGLTEIPDGLFQRLEEGLRLRAMIPRLRVRNLRFRCFPPFPPHLAGRLRSYVDHYEEF